MSSTRSIVLAAALVTLTACVPDAPDEPRTQTEREQALRESAFGGLVEPMDRAAELQQLQLDRKREIDAALEQ